MQKHLTRENVEIAICEMSNQHLKNYIELQLNAVSACNAVLKQKDVQENINEIIHGVSRKQQVHLAKERIKQIYAKLPEYIMEASIRGINFNEKLREVFEREEKPLEIFSQGEFRIELLLD